MVAGGLRFAALLAFAFVISGCKEVLYSGLTEVEANEMVAVLATADIDARRSRDKKGVYELLIDRNDVAISTIVLKEAGLPKSKFQSLGEVFSASGIIGTPFEQQARYIFAMNEELSRTVTEIDGIDKARVSVNAPLPDRYNRDSNISTASVTIHYENGFDTESNIAKIKQIVAHSMPKLPYDNVSVVFFPSNNLTISVPDVSADASTAVSSAAKLSERRGGGLSIVQLLPLLFGGVIIVLLAASMLPGRLFRSLKVSEQSIARTDLTGRM